MAAFGASTPLTSPLAQGQSGGRDEAIDLGGERARELDRCWVVLFAVVCRPTGRSYCMVLVLAERHTPFDNFGDGDPVVLEPLVASAKSLHCSALAQ